MQTKKVLTVDFCILVILAAVCLYMFFGGMPLDRETKMFPQIISAITFIFCMYAMAARLLAKPKAEKKSKEAAKTGIKHLLFTGVSIAYVLLLTPLGFIISSIALFIVLPVILGNKKFKVIIPMAIIATMLFYLIFKQLFFVNLPQGLLTFI